MRLNSLIILNLAIFRKLQNKSVFLFPINMFHPSSLDVLTKLVVNIKILLKIIKFIIQFHIGVYHNNMIRDKFVLAMRTDHF